MFQMEFEEKVDIEDLVLPSKPTCNLGIKKEPLEQSSNILTIHECKKSGESIKVHERIMSSSFATVAHKKEVFQPEIVIQNYTQDSDLEIENEIVELFKEFNIMSLHDYYNFRVTKVKQLVRKYQTVSQKVIVKLHEKTLEVKSNELKNIKEELQLAKSINLTLSKRIQELEMAGNEVSNQKEIIESFDNEEVLEKCELLEPLKCSKKGNAEEKKSVNKSKRKQSLQENENEFEESKRQCTKLMCDTCKKRYANSQSLQRHISSVHEGLKPKKKGQKKNVVAKEVSEDVGTNEAVSAKDPEEGADAVEDMEVSFEIVDSTNKASEEVDEKVEDVKKPSKRNAKIVPENDGEEEASTSDVKPAAESQIEATGSVSIPKESLLIKQKFKNTFQEVFDEVASRKKKASGKKNKSAVKKGAANKKGKPEDIGEDDVESNNIGVIRRNPDRANKSCTICKKKFARVENLRCHVASVHEGKKPFTCSICNKIFCRKYAVDKHIEAIHEKVKKYHCVPCFKSFATKEGLTLHQKTNIHLAQ